MSLKSTRLVDVVLYWRATYSCSQMILLSSPSKGTWRLLKFNFSKRLIISPDYFHKIHSNWTRTRPRQDSWSIKLKKSSSGDPVICIGNDELEITKSAELLEWYWTMGSAEKSSWLKWQARCWRVLLFFGALVITKTISSWKISNTAWWNCTFPRPTGYLKRQSLQQNLHTAKNQ